MNLIYKLTQSQESAWTGSNFFGKEKATLKKTAYARDTNKEINMYLEQLPCLEDQMQQAFPVPYSQEEVQSPPHSLSQ